MTKKAPNARAKRAAPRSMRDGESLFYLPLCCPSCSYEGKVKIARLDQTFNCKRCKKSFYVTVGGTMPGLRPADAPLVDPATLASADDSSAIERLFARLPRVGQFAVIGLLLLGLAYGLALWLEPEKPLPGELEDRAMLAAKSLGQGDWKTLKRLAKPKTAGAMAKWYEQIRPAAWNEAGAEPAVNVELGSIKKQPRGFKGAEPLLDARGIATIQVNGGAKTKVSLAWSQDEQAEWWLDGERLLAESKARVSEESPEETKKYDQ